MRRAASIALVVLFGAGQGAALRAQASGQRPEVLSSDEAVILATGWGRLAEGELDRAAESVALLFSRSPRSVLGLLLAVEVEIARSGATGGHEVYERWIGARTLDAPFALRRVARALLYETSRLKGQPAARLEALRALAADGEAAATAVLVEASTAGAVPETRTLAAMGNPNAVNRLIAQLQMPIPGKVTVIEALGDSGSPLAAAPLEQLLTDPRPEHRAAAARGLGRLRATQSMTRLKTLLSDPHVEVRMGAATALAALGDFSGHDPLRAWLQSEVESQQVLAAEALAAQPDALWHATVLRLTASRDPAIVMAAARLIAPYQPDVARALVEQLLANPNVAVREAAGHVFASHVAGDFRTLRAMFRASDLVVRVAAAARVLELTR